MKIPARTALALAAAPLLCAALCPTPAAAAQPAANPWKDRAVHTYDALQKHLYQGAEDHGLYMEKFPRQGADNAHSYLWPMREAAVATVDMAALPGEGGTYTADAAERFATLELYFEPRDGRPGYDSYLPHRSARAATSSTTTTPWWASRCWTSTAPPGTPATSTGRN